MTVDLGRVRAALGEAAPLPLRGRVTRLTGLVLEAAVGGVRQGEAVEIRAPGREPLQAEVVGLRDDRAVLVPFGDLGGVGLDAEVVPTGRAHTIRAGPGLLGRVLDGLGRPLDGAPLPAGLEEWAVDRPAPNPLARRPVAAPLPLGVRVLDGFLTAGEGQRIGLFAGSGVGKSTLLGQLARGARADLCVVCLVGERGREVREFLEGPLGAEGLARSVVVAATSDAPALVRLKAAHVATAVAEWFAERGDRVLLLVDSVTRYARALREVGLAAGEPPARQGYPPSVFAALPRLLERAGNRARGGITAVYTVLVAGGDLEEPIADEVRGILDGHVVLDRAVASGGRFPAVDPLQSLSRVMPAVAAPAHLAAAGRVRALLAAHARVRDLVALGAYRAGADPEADLALARLPAIEAFLRQPLGEAAPFEETLRRLEALAG
ncbi:ATPase, FliI/YscN family [Anaeromyxobacter dehalogenans 2CP-1]|uniref:ATPase, FliI/YscN family n=1 Tax=Anaeromyxobacter dehalogenans (strain ATCC BAA-258 / DSM 21875 / 2CP-1) TaxID=455488 RepID=B8JB66_ANAD2|nr:FliI/YscN family ATPase [Anaeromyxobacter dehalogenans]ACL65693.1 ATPase, FliI/YscN family [Anaeromyxobacter dehalogenans 2CP-1]